MPKEKARAFAERDSRGLTDESSDRRARKKAAREAGKAWIEVKLRKADGLSWSMSGPGSDDQAFIVCMAAKGLDPLQIAEEVASFSKPGGERESRYKRASSLRSLLDGLRELRAGWIAANAPGLP